MANTKIPSELIADSSITAAKLADGTITTADIADSNVTTAKIADSNVTTAKIGDAQVTTAKITDANVTTGKIADDAVTTAKMASNSVTSDTLASGLTLAGNTNISGTLTTTGNITLNSTGNLDIYMGVAGSTEASYISRYGNDLYIYNKESSGSLFLGTDNATKLTIDQNGVSTFSSGYRDMVVLRRLSSNGDAGIQFQNTSGNLTTLVAQSAGNFTIDTAADIKLDADSSNIYLADGGTDIGLLSVNNEDLNIRNLRSDKDIYFQGSDSGTTFTALTLDMSEAGAATFSSSVTATGNYTAGNDASMFIFQRAGGAVSGNIEYNDATTDMEFGTTTAHNFSLKTANTRRLTIDNAGTATFTGTAQATRVGIGVAPHATAGLNITSTAQHVRFNNGSELGIISLESDGALRIWSHGDVSNNEIEFYQGTGSGAASMTIDGSGDVGIGTATPLGKLHVRDGSAQSGISHTYIYDGSGVSVEATEAAIQLMSEDSGTHGGSLLWRYGNNAFAAIANPTNDTIDFTYGVTTANDFQVHSGTNMSSYLKIMSIGANGKVGIGTGSNVDELLHIEKSAGTTLVKTEVAANSIVGFEIQKTGPTTSNWRIVDGQTVNGNLEIYDVTDSRSVMMIDGDGDIGMGVTPATHAKLTLGGTATSYNSVLAFDNNTAGGATFFMLASDNTWSAGANKFLMGHGSPSSSATDIAIDADGHVGIGITSPDAPLHVSGGTTMTGGWGRTLSLAHNFPVLVFESTYSSSAYAGIGYDNTTGLKFYVNSSSNDVVGNSNTPALTILDNKNVGIGTENPTSKITVQETSGSVVSVQIMNNVSTANSSVQPLIQCQFNGDASLGTGTPFIKFANQNDFIGSITGAPSATAYNTLSDYRLKENVDYSWDATTRLKQLKPARFNFISDETNTLIDGFLAHEVSSVVPNAVIGEKDEVDTDGKAVMQAIDHSKLVPLLVKTIQELEARIATLEG